MSNTRVLLFPLRSTADPQSVGHVQASSQGVTKMTYEDTVCGTCGKLITDEPSNVDPALREPCPSCGALNRKVSLSAHVVCHATVSAELSVTTYPQTLLLTARDLLDRGQFGISVVVAHMACEVATERSLSEAFVGKALEYLEEPVLGFLNGYNLASDRNRKLYAALTGDTIEQQPFWKEFKASSTRRNAIIHQGKIVGKDEAEQSLSSALSFVKHLKK
jgi:hypothetical protein